MPGHFVAAGWRNVSRAAYPDTHLYRPAGVSFADVVLTPHPQDKRQTMNPETERAGPKKTRDRYLLTVDGVSELTIEQV